MITIFRKISFILIFILFICLNGFSQPTGQYRLGITVENPIISNKDQFEFTASTGQKVVLNSANKVVYFTAKFAPGQNYSITQTTGPRNCEMYGKNQGTFGNQDILVTVQC